MSAKSQVVIPEPIRDKLVIPPGSVITFEERDREVVRQVVEPPVSLDPFDLFEEWASEMDEQAYSDLHA